MRNSALWNDGQKIGKSPNGLDVSLLSTEMHHLVEAEGGMSLELHQFERRIEVLKEIVQVLLRQLDLFIHSKVAEKTAGDIPSLRQEVQRFEIELITSALLRTGGSQLKAARLLGVKLSTLNAKIKRYGITSAFLVESARDAAAG